jgi:hypothetical protein
MAREFFGAVVNRKNMLLRPNSHSKENGGDTSPQHAANAATHKHFHRVARAAHSGYNQSNSDGANRT